MLPTLAGKVEGIKLPTLISRYINRIYLHMTNKMINAFQHELNSLTPSVSTKHNAVTVIRSVLFRQQRCIHL